MWQAKPIDHKIPPNPRGPQRNQMDDKKHKPVPYPEEWGRLRAVQMCSSAMQHNETGNGIQPPTQDPLSYTPSSEPQRRQHATITRISIP